jgi:hypothetical protein
MVLFVGIGQQASLGPDSRIVQHEIVTDGITDDVEVEQLDYFNYTCYAAMAGGIIFSACVILRRLGMAKFMYQHPINPDSRLDDSVLEMLNKRHVENASVWVSGAPSFRFHRAQIRQ